MEYVVDRDWPAKPSDIMLNDVAGVAVDDSDRVYVFSRSAHPVTMFAADGKYLGSWGAGIFGRPHGIDIGPDGAVYLTDDGDHTVRKFTPDGKLLMQLGNADHPSEYMSGQPFNRCTHTALSPAGDIYESENVSESAPQQERNCNQQSCATSKPYYYAHSSVVCSCRAACRCVC